MQRIKEEHMNVTANHIETAFKRDIKHLLSAINVMMTATTPPSVVGTQSGFVLCRTQIIAETLCRSGCTALRQYHSRIVGMFQHSGNDGICYLILRRDQYNERRNNRSQDPAARPHNQWPAF